MSVTSGARPPVGPLLIAIALAVPSACAERPNVPAETPSFAVRDSTGIEIVANRAPAWAPREAWTIDPEPALVTGAVARFRRSLPILER